VQTSRYRGLRFVRNLIGYTSLSIALVGLLILIVLMLSPGIRYGIFRIAAEMPTVATFFAIRGPVFNSDFQGAVSGLERQLNMSRYYGSKRSMNLPGLVENTEFAINSVVYDQDIAHFSSFLERLVEKQPDLHIARVWLAKSLVSTNPEKAIEHLELAAKMVPSDHQTFRLAVEAALELGRTDLATSWCERYQKSQFGGLHAYRYNTVFEGAGLRNIALETVNSKGQSQLVRNAGVNLGQKTTYDFTLPLRREARKLRFHIGFVPGIKVNIHEIRLYGQEGVTVIPAKDLIVSLGRGYFLGENSFVTVSNEGDVLTIRPHNENLGKIDRVDLAMTAERLGLAQNQGCLMQSRFE
jgi:hypothetical protein